MGTQVAALYNDGKQDMVLSSVAAGALVPGAGELVVWFGDGVLDNQSEGMVGLQQCMDRLQERDVPVAAAVTSASVGQGLGKAQVAFLEGAATAVLTENDVAVFYDQAFDSGFGASTQLWTGMFKRAREKLLEEKLKLS